MTEPAPSPSLTPLDEDWGRALAVVAHPDDIEYGAAMAVARWTSEGKWVGYVLATRGEAGIDGMAPEEAGPVREEEERRSAEVVGVSTVDFLDHADGVLEYGLPLRRDLARAIRRHRPDVIISINHRLTFGPTMLNMADHRVLGIAVLDAARDAGNRWIFPELLDEGLEPWGGTRWVAFAASPDGRHAVDVSGWLDAGVESLECHRAYIDGLGDASFDPAEFLAGNARRTGAELGTDLAVGFELIEL
jgi:LmbE family N-acetylglucosaminyl deacetylase